MLPGRRVGHVTGMEAPPPCSPWTDASSAPRGGPLPRRLDSLLFREAQADVVSLNRFLMRLLPRLARGWASSAGNLDCITGTTRCSS